MRTRVLTVRPSRMLSLSSRTFAAGTSKREKLPKRAVAPSLSPNGQVVSFLQGHFVLIRIIWIFQTHASLGNASSDVFRMLSVVGAYEYAQGGRAFCEEQFVRPKVSAAMSRCSCTDDIFRRWKRYTNCGCKSAN